jgi:hypothetical protein
MSMKARVLCWKCPACGASNIKSTNIPENPVECRGKCSQEGCARNVRNVYEHIERASTNEGFTGRGARLEGKRMRDGLNAERGLNE